MKNILLVCDVGNWAWHFKATEIKENLSSSYNIDIVYTNTSPSYNDINLEKSQYDHIHIFGWYKIGKKEEPYLNKISTTIASIEYEILDPKKAENILSKIKIVAVSKVLYDHLLKKGYNVYPCYNGVNEIKFMPDKIRLDTKFKVGIACKPPSKYDLHGYTIAEKIKKHFDNIENNANNIEIIMHIANHKTASSHKDMANFYNSLDVFIHTGRYHLGTPNPVFESASCGIATIGTTNGCIPLLIKNGHNGYLIDIDKSDDNKINQFIEYITFLSQNRDLCKKMGENNRKEILSNWTWKQRALDWISVFEE